MEIPISRLDLSRGSSAQIGHFWRYNTTYRGLVFNKPLDIVVLLLIFDVSMWFRFVTGFVDSTDKFFSHDGI